MVRMASSGSFCDSFSDAASIGFLRTDADSTGGSAIIGVTTPGSPVSTDTVDSGEEGITGVSSIG